MQVYRVERGDTPNGIADKFGIQATTLLGGNPSLSQESSLLQTGVDLIILPIDGVLHDVQPGDTLESISAQYGIPVDAIVAYAPNNLEFPYRLYPETQIMVPGAVRDVFVWTPPSLESVRRRRDPAWPRLLWVRAPSSTRSVRATTPSSTGTVIPASILRWEKGHRSWPRTRARSPLPGGTSTATAT